MYIRSCPQCDAGKMLATSMKRGWGKEYKYVCSSCGYSKWIYEGSPSAGGSYENSKKSFWLLLILIEAIVFFNSDIIGVIGYVIYTLLLILFSYNLLTPNKLEPECKIVEWVDLITPEEAEEELGVNYAMKDNKILLLIGIVIASVFFSDYFKNWYILLFALVSYIVMYYYGFLDISSLRRSKFFKDEEFEKEIEKIIVKIDSEGKPILEET